MAVTFKAAQNSAAFNASSGNISYPASKASGDLAIVTGETGNTASAPTLAGFTLVDRAQIGSTGSDSSATQIFVFRRELDGSEGASAAFAGGQSHFIANMMLYNGHDSTTPCTVSTQSGSASAQTSVSTNSIAQKSGDGNDMFLACYAWDRDSATASTTTNSNFANLSGETITNRANRGTTNSGGGGYVVEEGDPASDSTGAVSHSMDFTSSIWAGILVRINAAASGTTYNDNYSESLTASDSQAAAATFAPTLTESGTLAASLVAVGTFVPAFSESATAADSIAATTTFAPALSEAITGADSVDAVATFGIVLSEGVTAADAIAAGLSLTAAIDEALSAADDMAAATTFVSELLEALGVLDTLSVVATFAANLAEDIAANDNFVGVVVPAGGLPDVPGSRTTYASPIYGTAADDRFTTRASPIYGTTAERMPMTRASVITRTSE